VNFYPHHIGDYLTATAHLTWLEDCAYRRLLDVYYSREKPLPVDLIQSARLVRAASKTEVAAVEVVLKEFFTLTDEGWSHKRCEEEIAKATEAAERARVNGKKGGRPPKQKPIQNPEETQPVISGIAKNNPEESESKAPITITNINPPLPPKGGKPSVVLRTFLDRCKADSERPIPDDDKVFDYADEVGIPIDFLRVCWHEFADRYLQSEKKYKDWRAVFRKAVRGNWMKIWYVDAGGQYALTTVGIQAQRVMQSRNAA
jgi:uncharacterized protein YdaU (DUF1376 family)